VAFSNRFTQDEHPMARLRSRRWLLGALAAFPFAGLALPACAGGAARPAAPAGAAPATFEPVVVTTELVVGKNRFSIALVNPDTGPVNEADVKLRFYKVDQKAGIAQLRGELPAPYHGAGLDEKGVYVAYPDFDEPGPWGLEALATPKGGR